MSIQQLHNYHEREDRMTTTYETEQHQEQATMSNRIYAAGDGNYCMCGLRKQVCS